MSDQPVTVVTEEPTSTKSRFNLRKSAKIAGAATAAVAVIVVLKRKLNSSVDGALNVSVETDSQS